MHQCDTGVTGIPSDMTIQIALMMRARFKF